MNLNRFDLEYHNYLKKVLASPISNFRPAARTRASTVGSFGLQMEFDCSNGDIPLISTKQVYTKGVLGEVTMFTQGRNDLNYLLENKVHIWDGNAFDFYRKQLPEDDPLRALKKDTVEFDRAQAAYITRVQQDPKFAEENGHLGRVYGMQWRDWKGPDGKVIDQFQNAVDGLKDNPYSRYHVVSAWNPGELSDMALPPCHMFFQFYHRLDDEGKPTLDIFMFQRSCDSFLGVPFNSASEGAKLQSVAQLTGKQPGRVIHSLGDAHIYCGVGERADWYAENYGALKQDIAKASTPNEYRELKEYIINKATPEPLGSEGADHIPYVLEQLARQDEHPIPRMETNVKSLNTASVDNYEVKNYKPLPNIKVNGVKPRMAV